MEKNIEITGSVKVNRASFKGAINTDSNIDGCIVERGAAGFSPVANVTENGNNVTITITDYKGTTTATIPDMSSEVERINALIPHTASPTNKLVDSATLNSSVQTATSNFRGDWATYADIPTDVSLYPVDAAGMRTPSTNDYLVVLADEEENGGTWRYKYVGFWSVDGKNGWKAEYQVNETPFTADQLAAINSGITSELVEEIGQGGGGSGFNLFDTKISDHILEDDSAVGWALQGSYVNGAVYPDFYAKCLEEYNEATETETVNGVTVKVNSNGHKFYDIADKTTIDEFYNSLGSAWFYGVDTEQERIFLPRDKYFAIKGVAPIVGNGMTLGLTDGTYNGGLSGWDSNANYLTSQIGNYGTTVGSQRLDASPIGAKTIGVTTDPTKSGIEAHLNANEDKYLYICVGNTIVNEEQIDVGQVLSQAVLRSSLVEVQTVIETYQNGTSWYRVWSDGWCEQGGRLERTATGILAVTLLKEYRDLSYQVQATNSASESYTTASTFYTPYILNRMQDGFSMSSNASITNIKYFEWLASGYIW